ncbi:MAG: tripartite tricarboxylate transporter substrate binding protein [Pseudomonadota bacterium]
MKMTRSLMMFVAVFTFLATNSSDAFPQNYPNKPIRFLMPHPAGAGMDFVSRTVANKLTQSWGQQVIVDSRPGAGGVIGLQIAAKASPDGYTLVPTSIGPLTVNPSLYKNLPYDTLRDFDPVTTLISALNILVVNPSVPAKSVKELISLAKAKPGGLKYASSANGNTDHLAGELFKTLAGINMIHVPYKGGGPAAIAILNGEVDAIFAVYQNIASLIKAGKLRVLAVAVSERWPTLPEVPTVAEMGVPGFEVVNWYGLVAPARTPKQIISKINKEVVRALQMPDVIDVLAQNGMVPLPSTPEQFGIFLRSEIKKWAKVVKDSNIRVD